VPPRAPVCINTSLYTKHVPVVTFL